MSLACVLGRSVLVVLLLRFPLRRIVALHSASHRFWRSVNACTFPNGLSGYCLTLTRLRVSQADKKLEAELKARREQLDLLSGITNLQVRPRFTRFHGR
jgi:hypothetical protein